MNIETDINKIHFPLSEEDQMTYYYKTAMLGQSIPFEVYKIGNKYFDVYGTELDKDGNNLIEKKTEAKITDYISEEELDTAIKNNPILNLYKGYEVLDDMFIQMNGNMSNPIYKIYKDEDNNKFMAYVSNKSQEKLGDEFFLCEGKSLTEDTNTTSIPVINKIIDEFEKLYKETGINKEDLVDNGEIYYMNGNMGTDGDWETNGHISYFMSFYKSTERGFAKIAVDVSGNMYGCYYLEEGNGEPNKIEEVKISNESEMLEVAALLFEQTDEMSLYNEPINKIDLDANIQSLEYSWLLGENDEDWDDYYNYEHEEDEDANDWDEEDEYYESFHKKLQEDKNDNINKDGSIFDDRDREVFNKLKNQKEEKTVKDLIQDRIGEDITVGELNTILQSIFGKYDDIFLLHNDLYNASTDELQDLVIWDDDDMYTITFSVVNIEEGIIEITDVNVE